ncbi:MAG: hypothetical protein AAF901_14255 [Bacteroidota bacterium]
MCLLYDKLRKFTVSKDDHEELTIRSRSQKLPRRDVLRAQIILACDQGKSYDEMQQQLNMSRPVINKWKAGTKS